MGGLLSWFVVSDATQIRTRRLGLWVFLLGLSQTADLVTTAQALGAGGLEANGISRGLLGFGGLGLLALVKALLTIAMAFTIWLLRRYWQTDGRPEWKLALTGAWRGAQGCTLLLTFVAAHNLSVLQQLTA